jgi:hypothetical protein
VCQKSNSYPAVKAEKHGSVAVLIGLALRAYEKKAHVLASRAGRRGHDDNGRTPALSSDFYNFPSSSNRMLILNGR